MSGFSSDLAVLQRSLRTLVMHPGADSAVEEIVCGSVRQSASERLAVYRRGYTLRLLECMRGMHPAMRHALGPDLFDGFAVDYLEAWPSRGYSLANLDRHFADHLAATRPDDDGDDVGGGGEAAGSAGEPWPDFLIDLARLERLVAEVYDGPGVENQREWRPPVVPEDVDGRWAHAVVDPAPSLRTLRSTYPVGRYLLAFHRGERPPLPLPEPTVLALGRRNYVVQLHELSDASCLVLDCLIRGDSLGTAVQRAAVPIDGDAWAWFRGWAESGLFAGVSVPDDVRLEPTEVP